MTNREFYTAVLANENINADLKAFAQSEIDKLDARNDKRKNTQTKAQKENEGVMDTIIDTLVTNGAMVASEIGSALGISTQKASALCKLLVEGKRLKVEDVKIKNKGTVKQYSAIVAEESDTETETVEAVEENEE
jgi:hypothetical protein